MRHPSLLWLPLVATLALGPLAQRPALPWPAETSLDGIPPAGSPGHALPAWRHQVSLPFRAPSDRPASQLWAAVPSLGTALLPLPPIAREAERAGLDLAGPQRHFPLFPTGPPSQG